MASTVEDANRAALSPRARVAGAILEAARSLRGGNHLAPPLPARARPPSEVPGAAPSTRTRISVVCPSRLDGHGRADRRSYYFERALRSVREQSVSASYDWEIILAVDPGNGRKAEGLLPDGQVVEGERPGQAAAVNAGVRRASGDLIAMIEDDDVWHGRKIELQLLAMSQQPSHDCQFVSTNQFEVDESGNVVRVNDFPTPSGWLMHRALWNLVGPINETYRWHVDSEWLGRLNCTPTPRLHLVERSRPVRRDVLNLARRTQVWETREATPLVRRMVNPNGGMSRIARDRECNRQSREELGRLVHLYGGLPW